MLLWQLSAQFQTTAPKSCFMRPPSGVLPPNGSIIATGLPQECLSNVGCWSAKKIFSGTFVKMLMHILFCNFQMTIMITMENQRTLACQRVDSNSAFSTQLQGQQFFTVFVFLGLWSCAYYVSVDFL
jgi:hypothetical protein